MKRLLLLLLFPSSAAAGSLGDSRVTNLQMSPEQAYLPVVEFEIGSRISKAEAWSVEAVLAAEIRGLIEPPAGGHVGRLFAEAAFDVLSDRPLESPNFRFELTPYRVMGEISTVAVAHDVHFLPLRVEKDARFHHEIDFEANLLTVSVAAFLPAVEVNDFDIMIGATFEVAGFKFRRYDLNTREEFVGAKILEFKPEVAFGWKIAEDVVASIFLNGSTEYCVGNSAGSSTIASAARTLGVRLRLASAAEIGLLARFADTQDLANKSADSVYEWLGSFRWDVL